MPDLPADMVEAVARQICCEGGQCEFRNCDALADWGDQAQAAIHTIAPMIRQADTARITTLEAELAAMKARGDRLAEALDASGYAVNSAAMEVDAEWSGYDLKAEKYRKIVTEFRDQRRQALTEWRDQ